MSNNKRGGNSLKLTLQEAVDKALEKPNEIGRVLGVVDCVRGYKNPYNKQDQETEYYAYEKAMKNLKLQRNKVKQIIKNNFHE